MRMSLFDRFVPKEIKETDEPEKKQPRVDPYKKPRSELDKAAGEAKEQYPDDREIIDAFFQTLKKTWEARFKRAAKGESGAAEM